MTEELPEAELHEDEGLMLEIGWLDLWHTDRQGGAADCEAG